MPQNNDEIYGPAPVYGADYGIGDQVTFQTPADQVPLRGEIIHVTAPHVSISGQEIPLSYEVDDGSGFPRTIYQSDIIQAPYEPKS